MLIVYILCMLKRFCCFLQKSAVIIEAGDKFTIEYPQYPAKGRKITYATQSVRSKDVVFLHGPIPSVKNIAEQAFCNSEIHKTATALEECWSFLFQMSQHKMKRLQYRTGELSTGSYEAMQSFHLYNLLITLPFYTARSRGSKTSSIYPSFTGKGCSFKSQRK